MIDGPISYPHRHVHNPRARAGVPYGGRAAELLKAVDFDAVWREVPSWPSYGPTPLYDLRGFAAAAGIERLWYKDEGMRFGLGAFKSLGPPMC